jgi:hypothetical protein
MRYGSANRKRRLDACLRKAAAQKIRNDVNGCFKQVRGNTATGAATQRLFRSSGQLAVLVPIYDRTIEPVDLFQEVHSTRGVSLQPEP